MKVYISGPITGIENNNIDAFRAAWMKLAASSGHFPVSPIMIGDELRRVLGRMPTWEEFMRADIKALMDCEAICMLPGWMDSRGACIELELANKLHFEHVNLSDLD